MERRGNKEHALQKNLKRINRRRILEMVTSFPVIVRVHDLYFTRASSRLQLSESTFLRRNDGLTFSAERFQWSNRKISKGRTRQFACRIRRLIATVETIRILQLVEAAKTYDATHSAAFRRKLAKIQFSKCAVMLF